MAARRCWLLLWIALAVAAIARATGRDPHRGVIVDHLEFGRRLLHGDNVYADWRSDLDAPLRPLHAPYPPSFGLLTAPFALVAETLGLRAARLLWAALQVLAIAVIADAMRRLLRTGTDPPDDRVHRWCLLLSLLLLARFLLRDLHGGGGNLLNVALCARALLDAERGQSQRSGIWLGFSLATKPTQVWLLPAFLLMGHWRVVATAVATAALCALASIALLRFELAPWWRWLEGSLALARQIDAFAVPALGFPEFEWMNQSLRCAMARWLSEVPSEFAARVQLGIAPGLGLPAAAAAWTTRVVTVALLALLLLQARRTRTSDAATRAAGFAAALTFSLLASPLSWKAHQVALLPLVYLLLRRYAATRTRWLLALMFTFALLCNVGRELVGDDVDEWLNSTYVVTAFDLVLLFTALPRPPASTQPAPGRATAQ